MTSQPDTAAIRDMFGGEEDPAVWIYGLVLNLCDALDAARAERDRIVLDWSNDGPGRHVCHNWKVRAVAAEDRIVSALGALNADRDDDVRVVEARRALTD